MKNLMTAFAVALSLYAGANFSLSAIDARFEAIETSKPQLVWSVNHGLSGTVLNCSAAGTTNGWQLADMCRRNLYMRLRQQAKLGQFGQCDWQTVQEGVRFVCPQGTQI
jgi:hypothetical protein